MKTLKRYEPPVVVVQGRVATLTLASLCVGKEQGGGDNALNPTGVQGQNGTQATTVFEAGPDRRCFTRDDGGFDAV